MTKPQKAFNVVNITLMVLLCIVTIYPFIYVLAYALNDSIDTLRGGLWIFPRKFTFDNIIATLNDDSILNSFAISVSRTVLGTFISILLCAMLSFALADKELPGRKWITKYMFITTMFSGGIVAYFLVLRSLGLVNNYLIYIIPTLYGFHPFLIMRANFENMPRSIEESARMDGAGDLRVFFSFVLPLNKPIIATQALFTAVGHWNDWFGGMFYINSDHLKPAATVLYEIVSQATFESSSMSTMNARMNSTYASGAAASTPQSMQMAFVVILTIPILMMYPFVQKYFVQGVMVGSIKE